MKIINVNIFSNIIATSFSILSPVIVIPIISGHIGTELYGQYVAILSLCAICVVICDLGFGMYIPKYMRDGKRQAGVEPELLIMFIFTRLVCTFSILFFLEIMFSYNSTMYISMAIFILLSNLNPTPIITGLERYKLLALTGLFSKVCLVVVAIFINYDKYPIEASIVVQISMVMITNLVLYGFLFTNINCRNFNLKYENFFRFIRGALGFYLARIVINLSTQGSTYLVSNFISSEQTAVYSLLTQLYKVGQALLGAISRVLYTTTLRTKCFIEIHRVTLLTVTMIALSTPFVYLLSDSVGKLMLSYDIGPIKNYTLLIMLSLVFVTFSSNYGYPALVSISKERYAHFGIFLSSFVYFLVFSSVIIFTDMTVYYALLCTLLTDLASMLIRLFYANKFGIIKWLQVLKGIKRENQL